MTVKSPCFDCKRRYAGCHSSCESYREYKEMRETVLKAKHKDHEKELYKRWTKKMLDR